MTTREPVPRTKRIEVRDRVFIPCSRVFLDPGGGEWSEIVKDLTRPAPCRTCVRMTTRHEEIAHDIESLIRNQISAIERALRRLDVQGNLLQGTDRSERPIIGESGSIYYLSQSIRELSLAIKALRPTKKADDE